MDGKPSRACLAVVAAFAILSACAPATSAATGGPIPGAIWRVDLRPNGYIAKTGRRPRSASDTRISFISEDLLLVSFWTDIIPGGCKWKEKPRPDGCRLHALEMEVGTGRIASTHEWSVPFREGFIYPNGRSGFVLSRGNELDLYSSKFAELNKLSLPAAGPWLRMVSVHVSPSGKTLLADWIPSDTLPKPAGRKGDARRILLVPDQTNAIFETADLKELRRWDEGLLAQSISDNLVVARSGVDFFPPSRPELLIGRFDERGWRHLYTTENYLDYLSTPAKLLDDGHIVVQERNRIEVLNTEGANLFEDANFQKRQYLSGDPIASADGRRFGIGVWVDSRHSLRTSAVSVQTALMIYDVPSRSRFYTLPLESATRAGRLWAPHDFALSPDGSLLAHTADGFVELFHLPPNKSARTEKSVPAERPAGRPPQ